MDLIEGFQGAAFGLSDGVICISGMIIGACVATWDFKVIVIASLTGGLADALGNAIGFYLSELTERAAQIHDRSHGGNSSVHSKHEVLVSGILSFLATIFVLALFLAPFSFLSMAISLWVIFAEAIIVMLILGVYVGKLSGESPSRTAVKYALLAVTGAGFSYLVGEVLQVWLLSLRLT